MTTTFTVIDAVYSRLVAFGIQQQVSGDIYKLRRPKGSVKEDVVVNGLPINAAQVQTGLVNVNIHVPNLVLQFETGTDDSHANFARLDELTSWAEVVLSEWYEDGVAYEVENQGLLQDEATGGWYSNIRIRVYAKNIRA